VKVALAVVIDIAEGTLLLQKRIRLRDRFLYLPGGKVEHGEEPFDAVKRELREEVNITRYERVQYATDVPWTKLQGAPVDFLFHVFLCEISNARQIRNNEPEKHRLAQVRLEDLKRTPIHPMDRQCLLLALKSINM
jgi:8-oxo-dGTP pyrophosphatase MutT (NUDIX family)